MNKTRDSVSITDSRTTHKLKGTADGIIPLITILLIVSITAAGTYAYFSDVETSSGNSVTARVLDLNSVSEFQFNLSDMKPSYHKLTPELTLTWTENLRKIYKKITATNCEQGIQSAPETKEENGTP